MVSMHQTHTYAWLKDVSVVTELQLYLLISGHLLCLYFS